MGGVAVLVDMVARGVTNDLLLSSYPDAITSSVGRVALMRRCL